MKIKIILQGDPFQIKIELIAKYYHLIANTQSTVIYRVTPSEANPEMTNFLLWQHKSQLERDKIKSNQRKQREIETENEIDNSLIIK